MKRKAIFDGIKAILEQQYEIEASKIMEKAVLLRDIGIGSLEFMNFILDVEKKFQFVYNFEIDIVTIDDLINYIISKNST